MAEPAALGLKSGFDPPDLDRPGRLPHQQGLCEARLGYQDESPQLGAPGPETRQGRHQGIHDRMGMQRRRFGGNRGRTGAGAVEREGEVGNGRVRLFAWCLGEFRV